MFNVGCQFWASGIGFKACSFDRITVIARETEREVHKTVACMQQQQSDAVVCAMALRPTHMAYNELRYIYVMHWKTPLKNSRGVELYCCKFSSHHHPAHCLCRQFDYSTYLREDREKNFKMEKEKEGTSVLPLKYPSISSFTKTQELCYTRS